jgi:hypothetical protein
MTTFVLVPKRVYIYIVLALAGNAWLFQWTYPNGGYGALAMMLLAPIFNFMQLLLYLMVVAVLRRKQRAEWNEMVLPSILSIGLFFLMEILTMTLYEKGGC